ncbi:MAG TPA: PP2C family serine/threonine-protein phosphatase [Nocardioides sp.]|nr:PP2C family serine/threonine-protein phosphatase [Nocardioides sp.]
MSQGAWTPLSGTQIGSVHVRDGRPIQDAVRTWVDGDTAVVAVADGHGHHDHFRSDIGARIAVDAAVDALVGKLPDLADPATAELAITAIAANAVQAWTAGVRQHAAENPFPGGPPGDQLRPYGTTLLAMAAVGDSLTLFQIGDGDTVVVDGSGRASRPLPEDLDADGVTTASLCQPNPLKSLRAGAIDTLRNDVVLAFQCTDGFGSSRVDASGWWQQTGEELVRFGREHGLGWVAEQLPGWLVEPAQVGGDDTTLAILTRTDLPSRAPATV